MTRALFAAGVAVLVACSGGNGKEADADADAHDVISEDDAEEVAPDVVEDADGDAADADEGVIVEDHVIGLAAAFPIAVDLLTEVDRQYLAYFDSAREMTVVSRDMGSTDWTYQGLDTFLPWDVHNAPHMGVDINGHLHVAGNMHSSPLLYYRTTVAGDVTSLTGPLAMVGTEEVQVTYPYFFKDSRGWLLFKYRSGLSGDGVQYINIWDHGLGTWSRVVDEPYIADATASAYDYGPVSHEGWWHTAWMWRETPSTSTNHDVCYARSVDLVDWETSDGTALTLPIDQSTAEVVDPSPEGSGLLNTSIHLGFDSLGRPIVSYVRYDASGYSQVFNTRLEGGSWVTYQTSDWTHRIEIGFDPDPAAYLFISEVQVEPDGGLSQTYLHWMEGRGKWRLDEATLLPAGTYPHPHLMIPEEFFEVRSPGDGLRAAMKFGRGRHENAPWYFVRWEVATVIDPRPPEWPDPTELHIYLLRAP
jgi:hypothetical protein